MALSRLKILTVLSSFLIIIVGNISQTRTTTVENDHGFGEGFVKRIIHGEKLSEKPGYFLFTAPYRLCEGGCNDSDNDNFAMAFPLYVGRKGKEKYKSLYKRDFNKVHSNKQNAPFKKRTTRYPYTLCATTTTTTETTTRTTTSATTTVTTTRTTPMTPKSSFIPLTDKRRTTSQSSTFPTTVKPSSTMNTGITVNHIFIIINFIPHTMSSVTNDDATNAKPLTTLTSSMNPKTPRTIPKNTRATKATFEVKTQTTSTLYSNAETTINYDVEAATNEIESESTIDYDIDSAEVKTETKSADIFSKYTQAVKETPVVLESDYNNNFNNDYEPVITPKESLENYITNAKGVRCPTLSNINCNKNKPSHVTPEIKTLKRDYDAYKEETGRSLDYYISTNEDDYYEALHKAYFDRRWY